MEMRRILIDTNVYVAYKRGEEGVVNTLKNVDFIGIDVAVIKRERPDERDNSSEVSFCSCGLRVLYERDCSCGSIPPDRAVVQ